LDESQNIKNALSQTAQAVKKLNSQHKMALSGTPIENKLEELWSVFDFLKAEYRPNKRQDYWNNVSDYIKSTKYSKNQAFH